MTIMVAAITVAIIVIVAAGMAIERRGIPENARGPTVRFRNDPRPRRRPDDWA
jgi:hypothetical protein